MGVFLLLICYYTHFKLTTERGCFLRLTITLRQNLGNINRGSLISVIKLNKCPQMLYPSSNALIS